MAVTKIAGALLIVGLVVGVIVGYGVGFITYQPQISELQTDLVKSQSELSKAQSEVESLKEELTRAKSVNVKEVLVAVLEYIKENHPDSAEYIFLEPLIYDAKIEERGQVSPEIGYTTYVFKIYPPPGSERNWVVTIGYPIVPPEDIIYEVTAQYNGITWIGTVHQGVVSETSYEFTPPTPPTEPAPGPLSTQGYVYDDKLGYGFEYPGGWELYVAEDDFPDKNIKKVVSFEKKIPKNGYYISVEIEFIVKSATDLQEVKNEFKKLLEMSGLPILNETTISINNIDGYDILSGTPTWKLRQVVFFANGMAYIFKYSSQEEFYRMYEETFNNIINSFNIK